MLVAEEFTTEQSSLELSAEVVAQGQEAIAKDELPADPDMTQRNKESIALQRENSKDDDAASTVPRRHGSALPK
jgi:hypothetical protein